MRCPPIVRYTQSLLSWVCAHRSRDRPPLPCRAAVHLADIVACAACSPKTLLNLVVHALQNQFTDHADESRMHPDCRRTDNVESQLIRYLTRFNVEIIQDFHMIGNKPDWRND